jgi:hypothetical protein
VTRVSTTLTCALVLAALASALAAPEVSAEPGSMRRYLRWKRNGQLDYRLLLRRYMPVSSYRWGDNYYGYPYSQWGGLRQPVYEYYPPAGYDPNFYDAPWGHY